MKIISYFIILLIDLLYLIKASQISALCALINSTNIETLLTEWSCGNGNTSYFCSWTGITCNSIGDIEALSLSNYEIIGMYIYIYIYMKTQHN